MFLNFYLPEPELTSEKIPMAECHSGKIRGGGMELRLTLTTIRTPLKMLNARVSICPSEHVGGHRWLWSKITYLWSVQLQQSL